MRAGSGEREREAERAGERRAGERTGDRLVDPERERERVGDALRAGERPRDTERDLDFFAGEREREGDARRLLRRSFERERERSRVFLRRRSLLRSRPREPERELMTKNDEHLSIGSLCIIIPIRTDESCALTHVHDLSFDRTIFSFLVQTRLEYRAHQVAHHLILDGRRRPPVHL